MCDLGIKLDSGEYVTIGYAPSFKRISLSITDTSRDPLRGNSHVPLEISFLKSPGSPAANKKILDFRALASDTVTGLVTLDTDTEFLNNFAQFGAMIVATQAGEEITSVELKGSSTAIKMLKDCVDSIVKRGGNTRQATKAVNSPQTTLTENTLSGGRWNILHSSDPLSDVVSMSAIMVGEDAALIITCWPANPNSAAGMAFVPNFEIASEAFGRTFSTARDLRFASNRYRGKIRLDGGITADIVFEINNGTLLLERYSPPTAPEELLKQNPSSKEMNDYSSRVDLKVKRLNIMFFKDIMKARHVILRMKDLSGSYTDFYFNSDGNGLPLQQMMNSCPSAWAMP